MFVHAHIVSGRYMFYFHDEKDRHSDSPVQDWLDLNSVCAALRWPHERVQATRAQHSDVRCETLRGGQELHARGAGDSRRVQLRGPAALDSFELHSDAI